jgi:hypothetical protein
MGGPHAELAGQRAIEMKGVDLARFMRMRRAGRLGPAPPGG